MSNGAMTVFDLLYKIPSFVRNTYRPLLQDWFKGMMKRQQKLGGRCPFMGGR